MMLFKIQALFSLARFSFSLSLVLAVALTSPVPFVNSTAVASPINRPSTDFEEAKIGRSITSKSSSLSTSDFDSILSEWGLNHRSQKPRPLAKLTAVDWIRKLETALKPDLDQKRIDQLDMAVKKLEENTKTRNAKVWAPKIEWSFDSSSVPKQVIFRSANDESRIKVMLPLEYFESAAVTNPLAPGAISEGVSKVPTARVEITKRSGERLSEKVSLSHVNSLFDWVFLQAFPESSDYTSVSVLSRREIEYLPQSAQRRYIDLIREILVLSESVLKRNTTAQTYMRSVFEFAFKCVFPLSYASQIPPECSFPDTSPANPPCRCPSIVYGIGAPIFRRGMEGPIFAFCNRETEQDRYSTFFYGVSNEADISERKKNLTSSITRARNFCLDRSREDRSPENDANCDALLRRVRELESIQCERLKSQESSNFANLRCSQSGENAPSSLTNQTKSVWKENKTLITALGIALVAGLAWWAISSDNRRRTTKPSSQADPVPAPGLSTLPPSTPAPRGGVPGTIFSPPSSPGVR